MIIELLGSSDCPNCLRLERLVRQAADEQDISVQVRKVTSPAEIMASGVMVLPGLIINGRVALAGRVPSEEELRGIIHAAVA